MLHVFVRFAALDTRCSFASDVRASWINGSRMCTYRTTRAPAVSAATSAAIGLLYTPALPRTGSSGPVEGNINAPTSFRWTRFTSARNTWSTLLDTGSEPRGYRPRLADLRINYESVNLWSRHHELEPSLWACTIRYRAVECGATALSRSTHEEWHDCGPSATTTQDWRDAGADRGHDGGRDAALGGHPGDGPECRGSWLRLGLAA